MSKYLIWLNAKIFDTFTVIRSFSSPKGDLAEVQFIVNKVLRDFKEFPDDEVSQSFHSHCKH